MHNLRHHSFTNTHNSYMSDYVNVTDAWFPSLGYVSVLNCLIDFYSKIPLLLNNGYPDLQTLAVKRYQSADFCFPLCRN